MKEHCPFLDSTDTVDERLVVKAKDGDRQSLEALLARHQRWVYNLALRMVHSQDDAADLTQEALLKVVTKLSTFEGRSSFRTWLYRIVTNHVISMKSRPVEKMVTTFSSYGRSLDTIPDLDPPDEKTAPVDARLLLEEAKIGCMTAMLLCLDRTQRVVIILGELFGVTDRVGAEIMEMSRDNFRQRLSRARRELYQFMNGKCGLINEENPCRCARKTRGFIERGVVDPAHLVFAEGHVDRIRSVSPGRSAELDELEASYAELFRDHPFADGIDVRSLVHDLVNSEQVREMFDLS